MTQALLPFQYEVEKKLKGLTGLGGLPTYLDFVHVMDLRRLISDHVQARQGEQGWTDDQMIMALVLLNLAGGDCADDLRKLEADEGFCRVLREVEFYGRTRSEKRALKRRWRKERTRTFPSPTAVREYLELFHDPEQEELREPHKAFIPEPLKLLCALVLLNGAFAGAVQRRSPQVTATMDMDATLLETFKEALKLLPEGVANVYLRSDTAGYIVDLLKYCAEGRNRRFGVIEFAVGADVTEAFKRAVREIPESDWRTLYRDVDGERVKTGQEYAEVCFVPNWVAAKKDGPEYRYLAIREPLDEPALPSMEDQLDLPFPTMDWGKVRYKVTGIVTNRDLAADELIWWYRERCGKSEEAHSIMKSDLAGGRLPSGLFGANAAWWQIMILAFNLNAAMKGLVLGEGWVKRRMKAIRFGLIRLPGRVLERGRRLIVRLVAGHPANDVLFEARRRMACLCDSG